MALTRADDLEPTNVFRPVTAAGLTLNRRRLLQSRHAGRTADDATARVSTSMTWCSHNVTTSHCRREIITESLVIFICFFRSQNGFFTMVISMFITIWKYNQTFTFFLFFCQTVAVVDDRESRSSN